MSSDDSDCEIQDLPSAAECEQRCQRFAEVTGTDTALAMFFLQDRQWNLDQALNAFFEQSGGAADSGAAGGASEVSVVRTCADASSADPSLGEGDKEKGNKGSSSSSSSSKTQVVDAEPHRIRVLSWNIDGLEAAHLKQRTRAVIDTIRKEKAEVALLQEVVGGSEAMLREALGGDYRVLCGGTAGKEGYYTAVLLHKSRAMLDDFTVVPFHSSMMGRNLVVVNCCVKGVPMTVMTSHLESTKSHAAERKRQLQAALKRMRESPAERTVVFGGDLNLRDKELEDVGGLPRGVADMWEATGSRKEARYTWDTFRNDNLGADTRWRSKQRFDRLFLRQREEEGGGVGGDGGAAVKPVYFELVGLERLEGVRCFPSDHWGILTHFDILPSFDK
ncbi:tyrosyl-DNA phosphodiesterase 2-like [Babylonia areolata]|uniref:tyrosyl-DNA phosphodiesterase 2-like n=1 Tax=Babylonia areolata TaxID=304850 RepID=UPI003FD01B8A